MGKSSLKKDEKKDFHYYFHLDKPWAKFDFSLIETLTMTGNERVLIKQCVLPKLKVRFDPFVLTFNDSLKVLVEEMYISNPFQVCDRIRTAFKEVEEKDGISGPVLKYEEKFENGFQLVIPGNQSLRVSSNVANLLFQGKETFVNKEDVPLAHWFKIRQNYEDNTYYLICDLLQRSKVGKLQLSLINTLVVQNREGTTQTHLLWNNDESQGKAFLWTGIHKKVTLSIVEKKGNLVQLKGGLFFVH